jgi:hypothetical protein
MGAERKREKLARVAQGGKVRGRTLQVNRGSIILKTAVGTHKKPFVLMYRSMNGFLCVHPSGEMSQIPFTLLYIRANGIWDISTAVFRIMR